MPRDVLSVFWECFFISHLLGMQTFSSWLNINTQPQEGEEPAPEEFMALWPNLMFSSPVFSLWNLGEVRFFFSSSRFFFSLHLFPCRESSCLLQQCDFYMEIDLPGLSPVFLCAAHSKYQTFSLFDCSMKGKSIHLGACHVSCSPWCLWACHWEIWDQRSFLAASSSVGNICLNKLEFFPPCFWQNSSAGKESNHFLIHLSNCGSGVRLPLLLLSCIPVLGIFPPLLCFSVGWGSPPALYLCSLKDFAFHLHMQGSILNSHRSCSGQCPSAKTREVKRNSQFEITGSVAFSLAWKWNLK